jgi:hypothetical protein
VASVVVGTDADIDTLCNTISVDTTATVGEISALDLLM